MGFKHCDPPCYQWDFNGILIGVEMLIPEKTHQFYENINLGKIIWKCLATR